MKPRIHPLANLIAAGARLVSGVQIRRADCPPAAGQCIYFANHTSHLDFVILWSALPSEARACTRPVAAQDYWSSGLRAYLAQRVFRSVLIRRARHNHPESTHSDPAHADSAQTEPSHDDPAHDPLAEARHLIDHLAEALGDTDSLIFFPEGTRGTGQDVAPFRSGLYHLARRRPDVELVPVYLENLSRILPKGEFLPLPLLCTLTFGAPIHIEEHESKEAFLHRARAAVCALRRKG
jgi:1-acyl-sn-glycerol-3-phosphate acyltransferase